MLFNQKMLRDGRIVFFYPLHLFFINPFYALQNSKIFDTQKNMKHFKIYSKKLLNSLQIIQNLHIFVKPLLIPKTFRDE